MEGHGTRADELGGAAAAELGGAAAADVGRLALSDHVGAATAQAGGHGPRDGTEFPADRRRAGRYTPEDHCLLRGGGR